MWHTARRAVTGYSIFFAIAILELLGWRSRQYPSSGNENPTEAAGPYPTTFFPEVLTSVLPSHRPGCGAVDFR